MPSIRSWYDWLCSADKDDWDWFSWVKRSGAGKGEVRCVLWLGLIWSHFIQGAFLYSVARRIYGSMSPCIVLLWTESAVSCDCFWQIFGKKNNPVCMSIGRLNMFSISERFPRCRAPIILSLWATVTTLYLNWSSALGPRARYISSSS